MNHRRIAALFPFLCALPLAACAVDATETAPDAEEEDVTESEQEIKDGFATFPFSAKAVQISTGCTGTMIAPQWALTAAHCFPESKDPTSVDVRLLSQTRNVTHVLVHHRAGNYTGDNTANVDVALLHVDAPFSSLDFTEEPLIFTGNTSDLYYDSVDCFGYGAEDFHGSCTESSQCNAGEWCQWGVCMVPSTSLRTGTFTIIPDGTNPDVYYQLDVPNASGQIPLPGDSGGACWIWPYAAIVGTTKSGNAYNYTRYISGEAFGAWADARRHCATYDPRSPNPSHCSASCPCEVGEGDCDSNSQCRAGLVCVSDVGAKYGLPADYDMCEAPAACPDFSLASPSTTFCNDPACPCTYGEGDCDDDYDCGGGLVCRQNNGAAVGLPSDWDVCVYPTDPGCSPFNVAMPSATFCSAGCPCDIGEGDCDSNAECRPGLVCTSNKGPLFGLPADYDICMKP